MDLNPPAELAVKHIPVTGGASLRYRYDQGVLTVDTAEFDTRQAEFMPPAFWGNAIRRWRSNSKRERLRLTRISSTRFADGILMARRSL